MKTDTFEEKYQTYLAKKQERNKIIDETAKLENELAPYLLARAQRIRDHIRQELEELENYGYRLYAKGDDGDVSVNYGKDDTYLYKFS
jgi:predicted aminopeptidase